MPVGVVTIVLSGNAVNCSLVLRMYREHCLSFDSCMFRVKYNVLNIYVLGAVNTAQAAHTVVSKQAAEQVRRYSAVSVHYRTSCTCVLLARFPFRAV